MFGILYFLQVHWQIQIQTRSCPFFVQVKTIGCLVYKLWDRLSVQPSSWQRVYVWNILHFLRSLIPNQSARNCPSKTLSEQRLIELFNLPLRNPMMSFCQSSKSSMHSGIGSISNCNFPHKHPEHHKDVSKWPGKLSSREIFKFNPIILSGRAFDQLKLLGYSRTQHAIKR